MKTPADLRNIQHDLLVVEAMVAELEAYLKSDILFWQLTPAVPISPPAPMLTLGGYLLRAHRLVGQIGDLDPGQQGRLAAVRDGFERLTREWSAHTEMRLRQELRARLNSWQWFVEDCRANKQTCVTYYATEAELRTLIAHMLETGRRFGDLSAQARRLGTLDAGFRQWFRSGAFVWRSALEQVYPRDQFWWLYGRPQFPVD